MSKLLYLLNLIMIIFDYEIDVVTCLITANTFRIYTYIYGKYYIYLLYILLYIYIVILCYCLFRLYTNKRKHVMI